MAITFAITDEQDGDSAELTIAGVDTASSWTLNLAPVASIDFTNYTFSDTRTGSGNGTSTISGLDPGHYWAYVSGLVSSAAALSHLRYFAITDDADPVYLRCLEAVQAVIQTLALTGISSGNIVVQKTPLPRDFGTDLTYSKPGIIVSPIATVSMPPNAGTNERDDVTYPCQVTIFADDAEDETTNLSRDLMWNQRIARAFRSQRLAAVTEVIQAKVRPGETVSLSAYFKHNLWLSALVVDCTAREPRGTS